MIRRIIFPVTFPLALFSLAACSSEQAETMADMEMAEEAMIASPDTMSQNESSGNDEAPNETIPVSKPQIAYSYDYGFRLTASEIPAAQQAHIAMCNSLPKNGCRVINMSNSGGEGDYANGTLQLEVAASRAPNFGEKLTEAIESEGGDQISASISGEDLSKQIVDTAARLRSRELLSKRLTELLATRKGSVAELVEAERAVTQVNEEIDKARSWLAEMKGRVAYSKVNINYQSSAPGAGGFTSPIRDALSGVSSTLGYSIGAVITIAAITLPWVIFIGIAIWLRRRFKSPDRTFWGRTIEAIED